MLGRERARACHEAAALAKERMRETDDPVAWIQLDAAIAYARQIQKDGERVHAGRVTREHLASAVEAIDELTSARDLW